MKKENIASALIYLLLIVAAIITGSTVVEKAFGSYDLSMNRFLFAIVAIILGIIINVICLELLHALGARIGGYKVVSVNVLGFNFEKKENKWVFHFKDFDGLTGETRIVKEKENSNIKPYIWLPLVGYLFEFALMMILYYLSQEKSLAGKAIGWVGVVAILFIIISSMIALYNIVPIKLDTMTDGYRLVLISKKENLDAFNEWMRVENLARNGEVIDSVKTFQTINDFTANVNLLYIYEAIAKQEYDQALNCIEMMLEQKEKIEEETFFKVICQKIYILLKLNKLEEAKDCYSKENSDKLRRFAGNNGTIETLRAYIPIAAYIEDSQSEVDFVISKKQKAIERSLLTRANTESKIFDQDAQEVYKNKGWVK